MARLLPPESATVEAVAREIGVGVATLERWRSDALSRPARERAWTAAARFEAVLTDGGAGRSGQECLVPRARGLSAGAGPMASGGDAGPGGHRKKRGASPLQTKQDRRRIKELERELRRKEKALAEAAALLVLSKKLEAIFPKDRDEDA